MPGYNLGTARGSVDIDTKGLKDADLTLREAGRGLLITGGALLAGFGYVIKTAADFEKQMDFVQAITQATTSEMDLLTEAAIELGKRGPFGPNEVAGSFVELAKAGVETQAILDGVGEAAIDLAAAGDLGLTQSTEILVNTLKTFDLEADQAVRAVDLIAGAANASTIDVDDFAFSMRYAGSIAAAVGVPIEDLSTALAILGDRGIKGSTGGTSMRRVLLNLQPASLKAKEALQELGIITEDGGNQFFTAEGKAKSLAEVFEILNKATAELTDAERLAAFNTIFGARAAPSALILASQGAEGFNEYADAIARTTAADVAAARLDNLAGSITKLQAAIEAVFITSGTPFQKFLQGIVEGVTKLVIAFGELPEGLQTFILGSIAVVGILAVMSGAFLLTVGNIIRAIRVAGQLVTAFKAIAGVARVLMGVMRALAAATLLNPWVLLAAAIIALVGAFIYFFKTNEKFRDFVKNIGKEIVKAWDAVVAFFVDIGGRIADAFGVAVDAVKEFVKNFDIGDTLSEVGGFFEGLYDTITGGLLSALSSVGQFFEDLASTVGGALSSAFNAVTGFVTNLPGLMVSGASSAVNGFMSFFSKLPGRIGYAIGFIIGAIIKFNLVMIQKMIELGTKLVSSVIAWGGKLISAFASWIKDTAVKVAVWAADMILKAIDMGQRVLAAVVEFFSQLPGKVAGFLLGVLTSIINAIPGIVSAAADLGSQVLTSVVSFITQLPGRVIQFFADVVTAILNAVPEAVSAATSIGTSIFNGVIDAITGIPGAILGIITDGINMFTDMAGAAASAAKDFGSGLWNGFKDGMGIFSPSYIEKALFAVEGQAFETARNLNSAVKLINAQARKLPEVSTPGETAAAAGLPGINTGATVGSQANAAGGSPVTVNVKIDKLGAGVTTQDVLQLSRMLADETKKQLEAVGAPTAKRGRKIATSPS